MSIVRTAELNDRGWNDKWSNLVDIGGEMVGWILKKILGSKNQRELRRLSPINVGSTRWMSNSRACPTTSCAPRPRLGRKELSKIPELENQWKKLDEILPEAFAVRS